MAIDTRVPRSRRALLAAGLGGLGASILHVLGRPTPAAAANGDPLTLGSQANTADLPTTATFVGGPNNAFSFMSGVMEGTTLTGINTGAGNAVTAASASGVGLDATGGAGGIVATSGNAIGISASGPLLGGKMTNPSNGTALLAVSGGDAVTPAAKIGIYGYANQDANARAIYGKSLLGTGVWGNSDSGRGLFGRSTAGTGVSAQSDTGRAVYGTTAASDKAAILGQHTNGTSSGVQGFSGAGVPPIPDGQTGVQGNSNLSTGANGVLGRSTIGTGVWGDTNDGLGVAGTGSGADSVGVFGAGNVGVWATGAWGLVVDGPSFFTTSGKVTINSGSSTTITVPGGIGAESIGLAVLQTNRAGVWVRAVTTSEAAGTMTIYLNVAVSSATTIGWFLIN